MPSLPRKTFKTLFLTFASACLLLPSAVSARDSSLIADRAVTLVAPYQQKIQRIFCFS